MPHWNYIGLSRHTIYLLSKCCKYLGIILRFPFIAPASTSVSLPVFSHLFNNRGSCGSVAVRSYLRNASALCASSPAPRRGDNNFPQSAGHAPPNVAQDVVCLFSNQSALLAHIQPSAHDNTRVLPSSSATRPPARVIAPQRCWISWGWCSPSSHPSGLRLCWYHTLI